MNDILFLFEIYLKSKSVEFLHLITFLIENFYHNLYLANSKNINICYNKVKISESISLIRKFNLDPKNIFFEIKNILKNEAK